MRYPSTELRVQIEALERQAQRGWLAISAAGIAITIVAWVML